MNELHFNAWLGEKKLNLELWEKTSNPGMSMYVCVCVSVHWLMHDDGSFIFSAPLRALSVCITAVKWTLATKDVHGKRLGERVEEYASKHKHSRVGIYSKRISHLIKTSPQLPGGLCHTKRPRVKLDPQLQISLWREKMYIYTGFLQHLTIVNSAFLINCFYTCACHRVWYAHMHGMVYTEFQQFTKVYFNRLTRHTNSQTL